jgi:CheY-like chemotaxis protein
MKGHMWVESELGQGSTFHFTIPAEVPDDALPPPHSAVESALAGRRAVILSEQPTVRHVLSTMCRWWGIAPYEADQPAAALALLRSATPCDVFILDRQLGSRDGTTLIETVRSIPGRDALPLFLLDSNQSLTPIDGITVLSKPLKAAHLRIMLLQTFGACPDDNLVFTASQAPEFDNTFGRRMPLRILIADDDAVNQRSLALMLERLGYAATVVSGGTAAYEMARRSSFDLVFMDIGMPGLDGREVTRHIRRNSDHPAVPWIVAFTAMAGPGARNALLAAGMNDCLFKPFRADELTEVLARGYRALQQLRGVMAN